ncbi:MAG TPA: hypothetical protein VM639_12575 [Dongiaceae bacterium]|nr:hypothetical protein [Dongiaceae bacterium]
MIDAIEREGIKIGLIPYEEDCSPRQLAISLTTDSEPDGHGLTSGERLIGAQLERIRSSIPGLPPSATEATFANKTAVRIRLKLKEADPKLRSFEKYARKLGRSAAWRRAVALSGHLPLSGAAYDDAEFKALMTTQSGDVRPTKEGTWYFYFGTISPDNFHAVEYRQPDSTYLAGRPVTLK